ncbi:LamG domain-containing protein [Actinacidiphila glaucinigra]|uniref:LamG domain-containing protein n=1 Tax=Actinacidiphila glaucinigra TaxID=235986 RepID=UPI00370FF7CB
MSTTRLRPKRRRIAVAVAVGALLAGLPAAGFTPAAAASAQESAKQLPSQPDQGETPESLALAKAEKTDKPVDVPSLRTETSEVSARPDGTLVATEHTRPVRTLKDGAWTAIDTSLRTVAGGAVAPEASLADVRFSGGGDRAMVTMSKAGKTLRLTWPTDLPKPVLDGDTAEYHSVLPDVDLRLTATDTGFSQVLVVKTAEAAHNPALATLRLGMDGDGLKVSERSDGSLAAVDEAAGGTVFTAPKPMMYDSTDAADFGPGAPATEPLKERSSLRAAAGADDEAASDEAASDDGASDEGGGEEPGSGLDGEDHSAPLDVSVATDQKSLTLVADEDLLTGDHTVYPVMIDPTWETPLTTNWAGVSKAYPSQPYWHFSYNGDYVSTFGTGYCADVDTGCAPGDVKRVFYQIPVSKFSGKHVLSAQFSVHETHSYSCSARPVHLWTTKGISKSTDWDAQKVSGFWIKDLQTLSAAHGYSGSCPAADLEFGGTTGPVKDQVQSAATSGASSMTFGLRAGDETDAYGWKRFSDDASLTVRYNLPPRQAPMTDLSMAPGSVCSTSPVPINKLPQVTAKLTDPDSGEKIGAQFAAAWDDGTGFKRRWWSTGAEATAPASSTFKASGSSFSYPLPTAIPVNKTVGWEVRAWDGGEWGPWSSTGDAPTDCYFNVDTSVPDGPRIRSNDYVGEMTHSDNLPWTDGVGRYGTFTFDSAATDVVKYRWSIDTAPTVIHDVATTNGDLKAVQIMPDRSGPRWLTVTAVDGAGKESEPEPYYFNVLEGQPARAGWSMDQSDTTMTGRGGDLPAELSGAAAQSTAGHRGSALTTDGALPSYAATERAILDTSASYTVSAWVNTANAATSTQAAVSQNGRYMSAFFLGIRGGKWEFSTYNADVATGWVRYPSASTAPVTTGQWTHLLGVADATSKTMTLYVNGVAAPSVTVPSLWNGPKPFEIGSSWYKGAQIDPWNGKLDDVKVWDRALSTADIAKVGQDTALTSGLPARALWDFDAPFKTLTEGGLLTTIGNPEADALQLFNGPAPSQGGVIDQAVKFDGVNAYGITSRPQLDGSHSFSVTAWAKTPVPAAGDTKAKMVLTQNGVYNNELSLYYSASDKRWVFGRYQADTSTATLIKASEPIGCTPGTTTNGIFCAGPTTNEWTHLLGVYDAAAGKIRMYVNGRLTGETAYTATGAFPHREFQVGAVYRAGVRDEFFSGLIDDIHVFDRILTPLEAQAMVQRSPVIAGRWTFNTATGSPLSSPDGSKANHPAVLANQASIDPVNALLPSDPPGALGLNGTSDYATASVGLHTGQSFSLAGWAQTAGEPTRDMTVLSMAGTAESAVTVRWHYLGTVDGIATGTWTVSVTNGDGPKDKDGNTAVRTTLSHTYDASLRIGWNHLAVTYDAFTDQLSLYVNGNLENQACSETNPDDCAGYTSWGSAKQPFEATGGLQFGRSRTGSAWTEYFSGQIEDVWAYQGVLSAAQIIQLADFSAELPTPDA